jgi:hypothetical protein
MSEIRLVAVDGRALDGTPYRLPSQLPADPTVVVVAFKQRQQADVDRWIDLAVELGVPTSPLGADQPMRCAVVEVPVLGRRYLPARRLIDGGMSSSIADPVVLARTITVYTDPASFRRRCGIATDDEVTAILTHRDGSVSFHAVGPPGPEHRNALAEALPTGL